MKSNYNRLLFLSALSILFLFSCVDEPNFSNTPKITLVELINEVDIFPQFSDSLDVSLIIHFEDGDGDLGLDLCDLPTANDCRVCEFVIIESIDSTFIPFDTTYLCSPNDVLIDAPFACVFGSASCIDSEQYNIFLIDSRSGSVTPGAIPIIPAQGNVDDISGTINYLIRGGSIGCLPFNTSPFDTLTYTVQIKDRAGNLSNQFEAPPIIIGCD